MDRTRSANPDHLAPSAEKMRLGLSIVWIRVEYSHAVKTYPKTQKERDCWKYFFQNYTERLTLDRNLGTMVLEQQLDADCAIIHTYRIKQKIISLLDQLSAANLFFSARTGMSEEDPEDLVEDPDRRITYNITVHYKDESELLLAGRYDRSGLPKDFPTLMSAIFDLVQQYGVGEMIFPSVYLRRPRRKSDLIYCSVTLDGGYTTYYYRTEDDSIAPEDWVLVPVGRDNRPVKGKVLKVAYFAPEEVPFPVQRTKKILRRCTPDNWEEDQ